jgi:hypothetical protein
LKENLLLKLNDMREREEANVKRLHSRIGKTDSLTTELETVTPWRRNVFPFSAPFIELGKQLDDLNWRLSVNVLKEMIPGEEALGKDLGILLLANFKGNVASIGWEGRSQVNDDW